MDHTQMEVEGAAEQAKGAVRETIGKTARKIDEEK